MDIEEDVIVDFRSILGLQASESVPENILNIYKNYRHMKDVAGAGKIVPSELMLLILIANSNGIEPKSLETKPKFMRSKDG